MIPQHTHSAGVYEAFVYSSQHQRLAMPRTLRKKLERIVWIPIAVSVTPGMTERMVLE
jgi:hypothetical protein